jgi:signal transduction histidine kinase
VRNLITNAIRYGGDDVFIEFERRDDRVVLSVRDNGAEIPPSEQERIFLPYFSAHDPGSQPSAVGLGLTVSRQLADMMGGHLLYTHDGLWSVFELELPAFAVNEIVDDAVALSTSVNA